MCIRQSLIQKTVVSNGNLQIQKIMFVWMVRFADPLFLRALKQPYFVEKHENLIPEENNCSLQEPITRGDKSVLQNLRKK